MTKFEIYKKRIKNALGIHNELDITQITDNLYVAAWPKKQDAEELNKRNVELIVSVIFQKFDKELGEPPFKLLKYTTYDTAWTPIPVKYYFEITKAAKESHDKGKSVVISCKSGVNRSVAIAAGVLVTQGYTADEALELIREKRPVAKADKPAITKPLYEFERQFNIGN